MTFVSLLALCATASFLLSGGNAMSMEELGMYYSVSAFDSVCWYEYLKHIPTHSKSFNGCNGQAVGQKNFVMTNDHFNTYPDQRQPTFANGIRDQVFAKGIIPGDYKEQCEKYLYDREAAPTADESEALNDGGQTYPFKAFAHCLLHTLRERHGDGAVEDVKNEKTRAARHWTSVLLEQQNKLRALHGAEPLTMWSELQEGAQQWADVNAKECNMYHTEGKDRLYRGNSTGENLAAGFGEDSAVSAYQAADLWYEEIQDYPYPEGYSGQSGLFEKIGHFTQTVWKDSRHVGYGYAYNKDCPSGKYKWYVAARFYPAGNMAGEYQKNVPAPTK